MMWVLNSKSLGGLSLSSRFHWIQLGLAVYLCSILQNNTVSPCDCNGKQILLNKDFTKQIWFLFSLAINLDKDISL